MTLCYNIMKLYCSSGKPDTLHVQWQSGRSVGPTPKTGAIYRGKYIYNCISIQWKTQCVWNGAT